MTNLNSVDSIIKEIEKRVKKEIDEIKEGYGKEKKREQEDFENRRKDLLDREKKKFERKGELRKQEIITKNSLESKKKILNKKSRLLDEVFEQAVKKIKELDKNNYKKFMRRMIKQSVVTGREEVIPGEKEKIFTEDFIDNLNKKNKWGLKIRKKTRDIDSGFILKGKNFQTVVDFENIKEYLREQKEEEVIKKLFGKEE